MTSVRPALRVFLDAGVPDSIGTAFRDRGHIAILHREALQDGAPDELVCITALLHDAILVAVDKDMKQLAKRFGINYQNDRFAHLSLVRICCDEVLAVKRIKQAMSLIEHEWMVSEEKAARRLWVDIGAHFLRTNR